MDARRTSRFNIRSDFVRQRAHELAAQTGMTATQVVEEAMRAYSPPIEGERVGNLVRRGWLLVGSSYDGKPVTLEQTNADIEEIRNGARD